MFWPKPETILRQWERYKREHPEFTPEQHAEALAMPMSIYNARMETARRIQAAQPYFSLGTPLRLSGDWVIIGDVHVPFTDLDWAETVAVIGRKHLEYPKLIIAGDFLNMDVFSKYPHLVNIPSWAQERDMARAMFEMYLETFSEIVIIMGNHERRAQRFTSGAFDEVDIFGMLTSSDKVKTSNYGYCTVETQNGTYRITHPVNYGINQLTVVDNLAQKYCQHIIGFHEHHLSIGWDKFGRHVVVNGGCMVDPAKLAYVSLDDNRAAAMKQGFVMLKGGTPYIFGKSPVTDWKKWLA